LSFELRAAVGGHGDRNVQQRFVAAPRRNDN
jgi:hypothetical protein